MWKDFLRNAKTDVKHGTNKETGFWNPFKI